MGAKVHVDSESWMWAFLNHSCLPNVRLHSVHAAEGASSSDNAISEVQFKLTALTDIHADQELTFNYLSTEESMASPFPCACGGGDDCFRSIRGLRHADVSDVKRLRALEPIVAPHLADLLQMKIREAIRVQEERTGGDLADA